MSTLDELRAAYANAPAKMYMVLVEALESALQAKDAENEAQIHAANSNYMELEAENKRLEALLAEAANELQEREATLTDTCRRWDADAEQLLDVQSQLAVHKAKAVMYEEWLREHQPDCELLSENLVKHLARQDQEPTP